MPKTFSGGVFENFCTRMCLLDVKIFDFRYLFLSPFNLPSIYLFPKKSKQPTLLKLGAFYDNLLKRDPIYINWALSSPMETPDHYIKICEKAP